MPHVPWAQEALRWWSTGLLCLYPPKHGMHLRRPTRSCRTQFDYTVYGAIGTLTASGRWKPGRSDARPRNAQLLHQNLCPRHLRRHDLLQLLYLPLRPMAFQSDGVLSALVASAALHSAKMASATQQASYYLGLSDKFARKSHAFLQQRISLVGQPLKDPYEVAAVTLLLIGREALSASGSRKWLSQLACVRKLLAQLSERHPDRQSSWELRSLQRHFTYHDIMASMMVSIRGEADNFSMHLSNSASVCDVSPPETEPDCYSQNGALEEGDERGIDPLMGFSEGLFVTIRKIQLVPHSGVTALETSTFQQLEREVRNVSIDHHLRSPGTAVEITLDLVALTESYRLTALILLFRKLETTHPMLPILASRCLAMISRIPAGSVVEAGLTMPLFVAGGELQLQADIDACRARLRVTEHRYRFENIRRVRSILEEVWRSRLDKTGKRWEDVLSERQWFISLS